MQYVCSNDEHEFNVTIEINQGYKVSFCLPRDPTSDGTGDKNLKEKTNDVLVKILSDTNEGDDILMFHNEDGEYELAFDYSLKSVYLDCTHTGYGINIELPLDKTCWVDILDRYFSLMIENE